MKKDRQNEIKKMKWILLTDHRPALLTHVRKNHRQRKNEKKKEMWHEVNSRPLSLVCELGFDALEEGDMMW